MLTQVLFLLAFSTFSSESLSVTNIPSTRTPPNRRKQPAVTYDPISDSLFIYGGFQSADEYFDDMWRFDLKSNTWEEIHSPSPLTPGPRIESRMKVLKDERSILMYGGNTMKGPISDLWLFDIENFMVRSSQWQPVYSQGFKPPASYNSGSVFYQHDAKEYFAYYGGSSRKGIHNRLFILDISTYTWKEAEYKGLIPPRVVSPNIEYHNGYIYLYGGYIGNLEGSRELFRYELATKTWSIVPISSEKPPTLSGFMTCVYNDYLYMTLGFKLQERKNLDTVWRINLLNPISWENLQYKSINEDLYRTYFGKYFSGSTLYMMGGYYFEGFKNDLNTLNLDSNELEWKNLSKDMNVPTPRFGHAMEVYDGNIFIYGGKDQNGKNLIDMWKFDIEREEWNPYLIQSQQPPARSEFAYTRNGEVFILYGGQGDENLLDDMYFLNIKTNIWERIEVRSRIKPAARKGSCMAVAGYSILIFGGKTLAGYTNELWMFDIGTGEYTLLPTNDLVTPLAYSRCKITTEDDKNYFYVFFGEAVGIRAKSEVFKFDMEEQKWSKVRGRFYDRIARSEASAVLLGNKILLVGGHEAGVTAHKAIFELDLTTDVFRQVGSLPTNSMSAGMAYYKNNLYIHGGSYSFDTLLIRNIPTNNFYIIQLNQNCNSTVETCDWPCSKGTFQISNSTCEVCSPGSFSDQEGALECTDCPAGYYLEELSADSYIQCKPCDRGKYNSLEGQNTCNDCPYDTSCPIGSVAPVYTRYSVLSSSSANPELYEQPDPDLFGSENSIWLFLSMLQLLALILLVSLPRLRKYLNTIDIYIEYHNYNLGTVMYRRRTLMGGIFTFIAMSLVITIVVRSSVSYIYKNVEESKVLVPNVALEAEYSKFIAESMVFEYTFKNYGGRCGYNGECVRGVEIVGDNLNGTLDIQKCEKIQSDCIVTAICLNCELYKAGSIHLTIDEDQSFASDIVVKVTVSSSIPGETSSITTTITNSEDTIFRGIDPSIVHLLATPSLFLSEVSDWKDEGTGYHISELKEPTQGSLIEISEIPFTKSLQVNISMDLNQSILVTDRFFAQSYYLFLSSLAGSLLGVIGAIGFVMRLFERFYIKVESQLQYKMMIIERRKKRRQVKYCFTERKDANKPIMSINMPDRYKRDAYRLKSTHISGIPEHVLMLNASPDNSLETPCNSFVHHRHSSGLDSAGTDMFSSVRLQDDTHVHERYYAREEDLGPSIRGTKLNRVIPII